MNFLIRARTMLIFEEGRRTDLYDDHTGKSVLAPRGKITGGIGHNFDAHPLSDAAIELFFDEDLVRTLESAERLFPLFDTFPDTVRLAIVNLIFNVGENGTRGFTKFCEAVKRQRWSAAASEILDSKYARTQVPERAGRIFKLLNGEYPYR